MPPIAVATAVIPAVTALNDILASFLRPLNAAPAAFFPISVSLSPKAFNFSFSFSASGTDCFSLFLRFPKPDTAFSTPILPIFFNAFPKPFAPAPLLMPVL